MDGSRTAGERLRPGAALAAWGREGPVRRSPDDGLINRTWLVGDPPQAVLQWVNPIFDPLMHRDIAAVTERLAAAGVPAPRLLPTAAGGLWAEREDGCWRLMSHLPGRTVHRLGSRRHAAAAGGIVGRFHAALAGFRHDFEGRPRDIHDTPARIVELEAALDGAGGHPLADPCRRLGAAIVGDWTRWDGDLKISNLRFDDAGEAVGILDLDTLGPMRLACEMGDAWRSWCNPAGEDDPDNARFDVGLFAASARAWLAHGPALEASERRALVPGIERICLELAARFCADAVANAYFREDRERFPGPPGSHNLLRARGQLALARSARAARAACEALVAAGSRARPDGSGKT